MRTATWRYLLFTFRWPWRAVPSTIERGEWSVFLPWWGRPIVWVMELVGIQHLQISVKTFSTLVDRRAPLLTSL